MTEKEFYEKIPEWISQDISRWNHITLLAYFCHKYEKKNGVKFRLVRAKKGPTMGKEAADFAKLFRTLSPEDYNDLSSDEKSKVRIKINKKIYNYINWMFDYKFRRGEQSVNGTKLFLIPSIIVEFERMYSSYLNKQKNKNTFDTLTRWCKANIPEVYDTHQLDRPEDLKIIQRYADMYKLDDNSSELMVIKKAKELKLL